MWPFRSKKKQVEETKNVVEPPVTKTKIKNNIPREKLEDLIRHLAMCSSLRADRGRFYYSEDGITLLSLFYAKSQGFNGYIVEDENMFLYSNCIQITPDNFDKRNLTRAAQYLAGMLERNINTMLFSSDEGVIIDITELITISKDFIPIIRELDIQIGGEEEGNSIIEIYNGYNVSEQGDTFEEFIQKTCFAAREADLEKLQKLMEGKRDQLKPLLERAMVAGKNKYGEQEYDKYFDELTEFCEHFFPIGSLEFFSPKFLAKYADKTAKKWFEDGKDLKVKVPLDGIEFEYWCASKLEDQGWSATVSKASGDQGVDIIAVREDITVAVQCKRYSKPVGNKAVQEVLAGQQFYRADQACVISTAGFTSSAIELANATSIVLIEADFINSFSEKFGF